MKLLRLGSRRTPSPRQARPQCRQRLAVEMLEDRTLMSAAPAAGFELLGKPVPAPQYQWDMTKISAPSAWNTTLGSAKVVVADIDTGIDYTHPDLYLNVWINQGEVPTGVVDTDGDGRITFYDLNAPANAGMVTNSNANSYIDAGDLLADPRWANHVDNDGNGYVDDIIGWNFVTGTNDPMDDNGHGTHTAGTIGALHNGIGNGVDGVNGKVQIMALKALDQNGGGATFDIALARATESIYYSANNGARVSNNSWGVYGFGDTPDGTGGPASHQALYNAIKATPNVLFVASAGNNGVNNDTSPAANYPSSFDLPNIIAVAATSSNDQKPVWSDYGSTTVDLGAPGNNVVSTVPGGYATYSGTSMASPHVAGAAALILAKNDTLTVPEIKSAILTNVDVISSMSRTVSNGRLDVAKAITSVSLVSGSSSVADPGASSPDATPPTGNGKGHGLIQSQFDITTIDESQIAFSIDHKASIAVTPLPRDAFHDSIVVTVAMPIPRSQAQAWMTGTSTADAESKTTPTSPITPSGDLIPVSGAPARTFADSRPESQRVAQVFSATLIIDPAAPLLTSNVPIDETPAQNRCMPVPSTESASTPSGIGPESIENAANNIFWLTCAALFVAHGQFLSKSHGNGEQEERERRVSL